MSNIIDIIEKEAMRTDLPKLSIGDTVKVWVKVKEGNRERLQAFEGIIIALPARQGRQGGETARSHQEVTSQRNFRHALRRADIFSFRGHPKINASNRNGDDCKCNRRRFSYSLFSVFP